jgi:hypothetical protein
MAGSAVQASIVYGYFRGYVDIDATISHHIKGIAKAVKTETVTGAYFSSVTASTKQVRGKHPDVLISDETCETSDELIRSALPMVGSSQYPMVVMASTFHKIFGIFQETWDNAEELGYHRIQWDIFDVCQSFPADYWDRPEIAAIGGIDRLKAHARGRTGEPEGWVKIESVIQAWREKPTEDWFEVEYLGSRPSASGLVLKPEDVDSAMFDSEVDTRYAYVKGATCVLGIDWGFSSMTAVVELMAHRDEVVVQTGCRTYHQTPSEKIINDTCEKVKEHGIRFIYADSAGKFENIALQNELNKRNLGCTVIEVVFSKEKFGTAGPDGSLGMLGNFRAHFEQQKIKIPRKVIKDEDDGSKRLVSNNEAFWQYKRYRYQEGTDKPIKKDDHIPDATMCALQHFILGRFVRSMPVQKLPDSKRQATKEPSATTAGKTHITKGLIKKQF